MVNGFFEMRQLYEYIQPCAKNNKTERRLLIGLILSIYFWEVRGQKRDGHWPLPTTGILPFKRNGSHLEARKPHDFDRNPKIENTLSKKEHGTAVDH